MARPLRRPGGMRVAALVRTQVMRDDVPPVGEGPLVPRRFAERAHSRCPTCAAGAPPASSPRTDRPWPPWPPVPGGTTARRRRSWRSARSRSPSTPGTPSRSLPRSPRPHTGSGRAEVGACSGAPCAIRHAFHCSRGHCGRWLPEPGGRWGRESPHGGRRGPVSDRDRSARDWFGTDLPGVCAGRPGGAQGPTGRAEPVR